MLVTPHECVCAHTSLMYMYRVICVCVCMNNVIVFGTVCIYYALQFGSCCLTTNSLTAYSHTHIHTQVDNIPDDTTVVLIKFSAAPSISQQAIAEVRKHKFSIPNRNQYIYLLC